MKLAGELGAEVRGRNIIGQREQLWLQCAAAEAAASDDYLSVLIGDSRTSPGRTTAARGCP